jgi:uncharacterized glyoxalase superfamily protein PhnB
MHPLVNQEPPTLGHHDGFDVYAMPMFATLPLVDVDAAVAWYEAALGFAVMFRLPGPKAGLVHLRRKRYQDLLIVPTDVAAAPGSLALSFDADGELDALHERARAVAPVGLAAIVGPIDTPWNARELRVTDPGGHRLVFTARPLEPDPEQEAKWRALFEATRGG